METFQKKMDCYWSGQDAGRSISTKRNAPDFSKMIVKISPGVYPSGSLVMAECNNDYVALMDQTSCASG